MVELHNQAVDILNKKFNILFAIDCRDFDTNYQTLDSLLRSIKKDQFDFNDRILLVHMDTDYYDPLLPFGLFPINVIRFFKQHDIPLFVLLLVTNHIGIKKEFELLLADHSKDDYPTIVETLLSKALLTDSIDVDLDIDTGRIEKAGLCMMGAKRSHRIAVCNFLKNNNLLDKVALQTNFN
jgi:hypothetical protein